MFNFPVAQLCHVCIVGWHDANSDLRRLAEVWSIERNRRNRPTPQPLAGFLAQTFEGRIFHHNASLSDSPFAIGAGVVLFYSITSSARASRVSGTVRPSALTVLRL